MKKRKKRRICALAAVLMLAGAAIFTAYALGNPQASFPWGNGVTYAIYAAYVLMMLGLAVAAIRQK